MKERKFCDSCNAIVAKHSISDKEIMIKDFSSENMKVTDKDYGRCVETVKCSACGLVQSKYIISYTEIVKLYNSMNDVEYLSSSEIRGWSNFIQLKSILNDSFDTGKTLLEIGSGSGETLKLLRPYFRTVNGIEPSKSFTKFANNLLGDDLVFNTSFEESQLGKKFDIVIALDVIEHVVSPREFIIKLDKVLNENGIAVVVTPNIDSLVAKLMNKKWWHIRPPHLYYFSPKSMNALVSNSSLKIVDEKYFAWKMTFGYFIDSIQKLFLSKSFLNIKSNKVITINLFDSKVFVLRKDIK